MNEHLPTGHPGAPPANRAQAWFRVLLWLVPTVFAYASIVGVGWMSDRLLQSASIIRVPAVILLNAGFVLGTGWFKAHLNGRRRNHPNGFSDEVLIFFLAQIFLIPILLALILFCACLIDPIKF